MYGCRILQCDSNNQPQVFVSSICRKKSKKNLSKNYRMNFWKLIFSAFCQSKNQNQLPQSIKSYSSFFLSLHTLRINTWWFTMFPNFLNCVLCSEANLDQNSKPIPYVSYNSFMVTHSTSFLVCKPYTQTNKRFQKYNSEIFQQDFPSSFSQKFETQIRLFIIK